jgi:TolB-like protein/DNA-binding SARP family transcriptional activator
MPVEGTSSGAEYRLRLLGSPALASRSGQMSGRATGGRPLALLALLGSGGGRGLTRDKLTGLLWPDQPDATARHSLADTVYHLRKALGERAVRSEGELIRLDPAIVSSDVPDFDDAIARGDPGSAIELYRGPFLDGFHLPGGPHEFETWVDRERARLGLEYEKALESVAESAESNADLVRAVVAWRRLIRHDPANSRVALRLMTALAQAGDAANAIQFAGEHERYLRRELDLDLPDAVRELVEQLRNESAAGTSNSGAAVTPGSGGVSPDAPGGPESEPAGSGRSVTSEPATDAHRARVIGWRVVIPVALLLLFTLGYAGLGRRDAGRDSGGEVPEIRSLAVLPINDLSEDGKREYLADGLTVLLIGELGRLSALRVISQTTAMQYRGVDRPLPEIARELDVDAILEGSWLSSADDVRITLQLVHGPTDRVLWSETYEGRWADVIPLQTRVSRDVAEGIYLTLSPAEQKRLVKAAYVPDPHAYEAYLEGKYHAYRWGFKDARTLIGHHERAISIDPTYAAPHAALAEICVLLIPLNVESWWTADDCEAMAQRAIALEPDLPEAHAALALAHNVRWNWVEAEYEFQRAIELNPSAAMPRIWYALFLSQMMRLDEAVAEGLKAEELDPRNPLAKSITAGALMNHHRYDEGLAKVDEALALDPGDGAAYIYQSAIYNLKGMPEEGLAAARRAGRRVGEEAGQVLALEAWSYALMGDEEQAQAVMARSEELWGVEKTTSGWALVYLALGREEDALDMLEAGYRMRAAWLPNVTSYPHYDALRNHPRFQEIRRKMGLR